MTLRAIYENGVFRPVDAVHLKEHTQVEIHVPEPDKGAGDQAAILSVLRKSFPSGQSDVAQRHDEHQP